MIQRLVAAIRELWLGLANDLRRLRFQAVRLWLLAYAPFRKARVMQVICTFCAEVAVLVFVFPVLELFISRQGRPEAGGASKLGQQPQGASLTLVVGISVGVTILFLVMAVLIANRWGGDNWE